MPVIENSIVIDAPRATVLAVALDNESFPEFMTDVASVTVKERSDDGRRTVSDWVGIVPKFGAKVRWTEEDLWDLDAGICKFRQLSGDYEKFEGEWSFEAEDAIRTRFTNRLDYELEIPLVGPLIKSIIRKTMENNLDSTLNAIKDRAEAKAGKA